MAGGSYGVDPFGLSEVKIVNLETCEIVDTGCARNLSITPEFTTNEKECGGRTLATKTEIKSGTVSVELARFSLDAISAITGWPVENLVTSNGNITMLRASCSVNFPRFALFGKTAGVNSTDEFHIYIGDVKVTGGLAIELIDQEFASFSFEAKALCDDAGDLYRIVQTETERDLPRTFAESILRDAPLADFNHCTFTCPDGATFTNWLDSSGSAATITSANAVCSDNAVCDRVGLCFDGVDDLATISGFTLTGADYTYSIPFEYEVQNPPVLAPAFTDGAVDVYFSDTNGFVAVDDGGMNAVTPAASGTYVFTVKNDTTLNTYEIFLNGSLIYQTTAKGAVSSIDVGSDGTAFSQSCFGGFQILDFAASDQELAATMNSFISTFNN